jgi:hypothetical protein
MRKLLPETVRRREETKRRMEEYQKGVERAMDELDALCCKTPKDPYSDERDYSM